MREKDRHRHIVKAIHKSLLRERQTEGQIHAEKEVFDCQRNAKKMRMEHSLTVRQRIRLTEKFI